MFIVVVFGSVVSILTLLEKLSHRQAIYSLNYARILVLPFKSRLSKLRQKYVKASKDLLAMSRI